jgi:hypothetical protein
MGENWKKNTKTILIYMNNVINAEIIVSSGYIQSKILINCQVFCFVYSSTVPCLLISVESIKSRYCYQILKCNCALCLLLKIRITVQHGSLLL